MLGAVAAHKNEGRSAMPSTNTAQGRHRFPPGPRASFPLGSTLDYMRDPLGFLARMVREHGDLVRMRLGNLPTYLLVNPQHIEYVLRTHADNFRKDVLTRWLTPLIGE